MIGFVLSVILTAIPFWLVMGNVLNDTVLTSIVIMALAAVQIVVHMIYFLHMNTKSEGGWTFLALLFTLTLVVITLVGSIWVMYHMDQNMMPMSPAPQAPPPQWESRWGAVATDVPRGTVGASANMLSRQAAERSAMADCSAKDGKNCKLETWYSNGCVVLVAGDGGYNVTAEATLNEATGLGMKFCTDAKRTNCRVYYSACSPSVRIQ